ncbi:hypothetical protein [Eilatimonas milleporae]|uniref:XapX domain-containing protein n=1 Tax=Eilatimonas milleporae TaxID=911205 RepID=A0A3M0CJF5_9PROT|nr:hypothetical protein [Eilatimonas milleporae]RMB08540.1 hypothetical protein BXY39_1175 [Eilatimonas milleporae]
MGTRIGFFVFLGLIAGAVSGSWLPLAPSITAILGGLAGAGLAIFVDRLARRRNRRQSTDMPE